MSNNFKSNTEFVKHPTFEGVYMRHFFSKSETGGGFNNVEILVVPGFEISPHTHGDAVEYFYIVDGAGEFLDDTEWTPIKKGDAFKAPIGMTHAIKNTGASPLTILATFSPPIK
ncbi:MAG: cupin domain-containing protein [Clostridiales Family XIII bacterium]|jgi:mannose-6-phosphate isomerase-like protein (cupin superfamily)|nr:cupin domain-containing protein [Clostridiales Family XIII bacterium]